MQRPCVRAIEIAGRTVGPGHPTYVVAEVSANHRQDYAEAERIVHAAKRAGADAVKVQTYTPDTLTLKHDGPHFQIAQGTLWAGRTLHDLYSEACMPWEWHRPLKALAQDLGLDLFSTPFDSTAVDFLEELGVPTYKIASFELVDLPLIRKVARTGKPLIVSTGMATLAEIEEAVAAARDAGATGIALLKCNSSYPARPEEMNVRTIPHMSEAFDVPVGLSDHTLGGATAVAGVALGACIVEKHLTIERARGGPDGAFSLEPAEFEAMVDTIRTAERALGQVHYGPTEGELLSRTFRRSLFVVKDVRAGEPLTAENVAAIRPADGLHTRYLEQVLGRYAVRDVPRGTPLSWDLVG